MILVSLAVDDGVEGRAPSGHYWLHRILSTLGRLIHPLSLTSDYRRIFFFEEEPFINDFIKGTMLSSKLDIYWV